MGLVEFVLARLDEDERIAITAAASNPGSAADQWSAERVDARDDLDGIVRKRWVILPERVKGIVLAECPAEITPRASTHIARHDPARVLAELESKRRILHAHDREHHCTQLNGSGDSVFDGQPWELWEDEHTSVTGEPCYTLRLLALPYADHEDYREEWRP